MMIIEMKGGQTYLVHQCSFWHIRIEHIIFVIFKGVGGCPLCPSLKETLTSIVHP